MTLIGKNIGFIGAGVMAQAIGASLLKSRDLIDPCQIYVSAPSDNNLGWWKEVGCNTTNDNDTVFNMCDVIILAMKPQYLENALKSLIIRHQKDSFKIFISVLVGVSTSQLKQMLFKYYCILDIEETQVFRVMPNTAIIVGSGCSAYCYSVASSLLPTHVNESKKLVESIFNAGGLCIQVSEDMMNAVGALSGSGVAYVYVMIEAMCDGGVKMGIPRNLATQLAVQTFVGAANMVKVTGKHPAQLKDEVCSAGGTTIAAIHAIEKAGIRGGLIDAIEAATKRSNELAKKSN